MDSKLELVGNIRVYTRFSKSLIPNLESII